MLSASTTPIKASHKIVYSARNNTFIRNKKLIEIEKYSEPATLEFSNQITAKIFQNNQAIAKKLIETKSQNLPWKGPKWISDSPKATPFRNMSMDIKSSLNSTDESRKVLHRTLSVPKCTNIDSISNEQHSKFKRSIQNNNSSLLYDPSSELLLPKLEESTIDPAVVIKEAKAIKRFLDDRKKLRELLKHKTDISYLSDFKREGGSRRGSLVLELQSPMQNQLAAPMLENEIDSRRSKTEFKYKQLQSANLSPLELRNGPPRLISQPSLANTDLPKWQTNRFSVENAPINSNSIQFVQGHSHLISDPKSIHLNSATLSALTSETILFSKAVFSENKYHEGALLGLENAQAAGYLEGFTETHLGGNSPLKTVNNIRKISEKAELKSSELLKFKDEQTIENQTLQQELRREIPSILSGSPPSRKDTILLAHWIEKKLKAVVGSASLTEKQKCLNCDEIYNVGLNEVLRQVRFECAERAELLLKMWMSYLRVFNQLKLSLMADQAKLHDDYEDNYNRVHKTYKVIIAEGNAQREKLQKQVEELTAEKSVFQAQCDKLLQQEATFLQKNRELRAMIKKTLKQMYKTKEENEMLNVKLMSRSIFQSVKPSNDSQRKSPGVVRTASSMNMGPERRFSTNAHAFLFPSSSLQKKQEIQEDKESSVSNVSSENLLYETNEEPGTEQKEKQNIHKIEQLNSLALVHMMADVIKHDRDIQTGLDLYEQNHRTVECQTDLRLLNANYDELLSQQNNLDELVIDHKLKKEVDVINSIESFDILNHSLLTSRTKYDSLRGITAASNMEIQNRTSKLLPPTILVQPAESIGVDGEHKLEAQGKGSYSGKKSHLNLRELKLRNPAHAFSFKESKSSKHKGSPNNYLGKDIGALNTSNDISASSFYRKNSENLAQAIRDFRSGEETSNLEQLSVGKKAMRFDELNTERMRINSQDSLSLIQERKISEHVIQKDSKEDDNRENRISNLGESIQEGEQENKVSDKQVNGENINIKKIKSEADEKELEKESEKSASHSQRLKSVETEAENRPDNTEKVEILEASKLTFENNLKGNISIENRNEQQLEEANSQINLDELDPSEIYSSYEGQSGEESEIMSQASFSIIFEEEAEDGPQSLAEDGPQSLAAIHSNAKKRPSKKELILDLNNNPDEQVASKENALTEGDTHNRNGSHSLRQINGTLIHSTPKKRMSQQHSLNPRKSRISIHFKAGTDGKADPVHTLAAIKSKIDHLMQAHHIGNESAVVEEFPEITEESQGMVLDKDKYLQVVRLYKIETEKTKLLQQNLYELKDTVEKEVQANVGLTEENQSLKIQLDELVNNINNLKASLENSVPKCKHGRCQFCCEEEEAAAREEEKAEKVEDEKDEDAEQTGDKAANQKKRRKRDNKKPFSQAMQLGRRNAIDSKENPAPAIIAKLRTKKMSQFKNFLPVKLILKQISSIYEERLRLSSENIPIKDEELSCFIYNMFLNLFGFKKIAEQKLIVLVLSVKKNMQIIRINLFGRFLGLIEGSGNYTVEEFNKYIECLDFLNNCNMGTNVVTNEGDSKIYTPYIRFLEYLRHFAEGKLGMEEYIEFKKEFESIKETDPRGSNRYGVIDVDMALMKVLAKNRIVSNRVKQFVIDAFLAINIDGVSTCNLRKFKLLFKHVEAEKYDEEEVIGVFEDYAEANMNGEQALSYDQFAALCVELNIFSEYVQDKFLMITKKEQVVERFLELRKDSATLRDQMETMLRNINNLEPKARDEWSQNIDYVWNRVLNPAVSEKEYKSLLISISVLNEELKKLASV